MMEGDDIDSITSEGLVNDYHVERKAEDNGQTITDVPSDVDLQVSAPAPDEAAPAVPAESDLDDGPISKNATTVNGDGDDDDNIETDAQQVEQNNTDQDDLMMDVDVEPLTMTSPPPILLGGSIDDDVVNSLPAPLTSLDASRDVSADDGSLQSLDVSQKSQSQSSLGTTNSAVEGYNKPSVAALPSKKHDKANLDGGEWTLSVEERKAAHEQLQQSETKRRQCYEPRLKTSSAYWMCVSELLKTSLEETNRATSSIKSIISINHVYRDKLSSASPLTNDSSNAFQTTVKDGLEALNPLGVSGGRANKTKPDDDSVIDKTIHNACTGMADLFSHESTTMHDMILVPLMELKTKMEHETKRMQRLGDIIHEELHANEESVQHYWSLYYEAYYRSLSTSRENNGKLARSNSTPTFSHPAANGMTITSEDVWLCEAQYCLAVQAQAESWTKINPELTKLFSSIKGLEVHRRSTLKELTTVFLEQQSRLFYGLQGVMTSNKDDLSSWPTDYGHVDAEIKESVHSRARLLASAAVTAGNTKVELSFSTNTDSMAVTTTSETAAPDTSPSSVRDSIPADPKDLSKVSLEKSDESSSVLDETIKSLSAVEGDNTSSKEENLSRTSPLQSALMRDARVVERQTTSTIKRIGRGQWKLCLAVVTADAYLHLIDIPPEIANKLKKNTDTAKGDDESRNDNNKAANAATNHFLPGTSAEVVLQAIITPVTVPTEVESVVSGQQGQHHRPSVAGGVTHSTSGRGSRLLSSFGARNNRPLPHMIPALSVHLPRCTVIFDQKKPNNDLVDIVEILGSTTRVGTPRLMLRKAREQKMQLRTGSRSDALELLYHMDEAQVKYVENLGVIEKC